MGPASGAGPIPFRVLLDGEDVQGAAGTDVAADGHGTVTDHCRRSPNGSRAESDLARCGAGSAAFRAA